jgi:hypothetical protein
MSRMPVLLTAVLLFGLSSASASEPLPREAAKPVLGPFTTVLRQSEFRAYGIRFKYPEIPNSPAFNAAVHRILQSLVETANRENVGYKGQDCPDPHYHIEGRYSATILERGIVSVLLDWTEYSPCAAHPGGSMASVNYDLRNGRVLAISDLFRPGADYLPRLSALAIASMSEYLGEGLNRGGAAPVESNFKVFTLTDTSLVLHFNTYQVAAGAAGPQEVIIPLGKLAPLLTERMIGPP